MDGKDLRVLREEDFMGCTSLAGIFGETRGASWHRIDGGITIVIGLLL